MRGGNARACGHYQSKIKEAASELSCIWYSASIAFCFLNTGVQVSSSEYAKYGIVSNGYLITAGEIGQQLVEKRHPTALLSPGGLGDSSNTVFVRWK